MDDSIYDLPNEDFEYSPLPGPDWIRLLTIFPCQTSGDPIECRIEPASLTGQGRKDYGALSYSWGMHHNGEAGRNRYIIIGHRIKHIPQNLFEGIVRLRTQAGRNNLRIWIDAVCIDQSNDKERSDQVRRMRSVFKYANCTLVWLGDGHPDDDAVVVPVLQCIMAGDDPSHYTGSHVWECIDGRQHEICALALHDRNRTTLKPESQLVESLEWEIIGRATELFVRRYFRRRWVFQELFHSRLETVWVYWGAHSCRLKQLIETMYQLLDIIGDAPLQFEASYMLNRVFGRTPESRDPSLPSVLNLCNHMECSDPRDRLYSLAGIDPSFRILPDYTISATAAYIGFARMLLENGFTYCMFQNVPVNSTHNLLDLGLPSWVPDLRLTFMHFENETDFELYPNGLDLDICVSDDNTLSLSPYIIGAVEDLLSESSESDPQQRRQSQVWVINANWKWSSDIGQPRPRLRRRTKLLRKARSSVHLIKDLSFRSHASTVQQEETDPPTLLILKNNVFEIQPGDICCSLTNDVSRSNLMIVRAIDAENTKFRVVGRVENRRQLSPGSRSMFENLPTTMIRERIHLV